MVIVILGIVSAVATSRYARYTREARIAALNGLAGAIRSSVQIVRMRYYANGTNTTPVTLAGGITVAVATNPLVRRGLPLSTAAGLPGRSTWPTPSPIRRAALKAHTTSRRRLRIVSCVTPPRPAP